MKKRQFKSITITITKYDLELSKSGYPNGTTITDAKAEYVDGKPTGAVWFGIGENHCVAYLNENCVKH